MADFETTAWAWAYSLGLGTVSYLAKAQAVVCKTAYVTLFTGHSLACHFVLFFQYC